MRWQTDDTLCFAVMQELTEYERRMLEHPETREDVVRAAQHRTTAADLGIAASDDLKDLESLPARVAFLNSLADQVRSVRRWTQLSRHLDLSPSQHGTGSCHQHQ